MPGLAPESAEVVELSRDKAYVVVRASPAGFVVLDEAGRLVRRRELTDAIARHRYAIECLEAAIREARLERRLEHAARGVVLLRPATEARILVAELADLAGRIERLLDSACRGTLLTERTLRRRASELNDAARADRRVVFESRRLAPLLAAAPRRVSKQADTLRRWVGARLASPDLPFFHPEFDEADAARAVERFRTALRR